MGGETSIQIFQCKGREFPNEDSISLLEFFPLTSRLNDIDLKNMIKKEYGYCVCRQIIHNKTEGSIIQKKYFPERDLEKMNWIYVGIIKDTNCRCSFYELINFKDIFIKEMKLLHDENKELRKLIDKSNSEIVALKSKISTLENKLNNIDKKIPNPNA